MNNKRTFITCNKKKAAFRQGTDVCENCELNVSCKSYKAYLKDKRDQEMKIAMEQLKEINLKDKNPLVFHFDCPGGSVKSVDDLLEKLS